MKNRPNRKKSMKAQAALEYFVLFAVIGAATLLSMEVLWPRVRDVLHGGQGTFYYDAGTRLINADTGGRTSF